MTHIQQRRDQSVVWTSTNPVLYNGEVGWEIDTRRGKLGDGSTAWNDLPYLNSVLSVAGREGHVTLDVDDVAGAAPLESPALTGNPTAPTPIDSDNDNSIATTAFVKSYVDPRTSFPWVDFTPNWRINNVVTAIGDGYNEWHYQLIENTVHVNVEFWLPSTAIAAGPLSWELPFPCLPAGPLALGGSVVIVEDSRFSNSAQYLGVPRMVGTSAAQIEFAVPNGTGLLTPASTTTPFAWGASGARPTVRGYFTYERVAP